MTSRTEIVGPIKDYRPQHGQQPFTAGLVIMRFLGAGGSNLPVARDGEAIKTPATWPLPGGAPGPVHRVPHQHLDGFQLHPACLMPTLEDDLEHAVYFLRHFPLDSHAQPEAARKSFANIGGGCTSSPKPISSPVEAVLTLRMCR